MQREEIIFCFILQCNNLITIAGLGWKGVQSHSHAPAQAILKTQVWYIKRLKHCVVRFPNCS